MTYMLILNCALKLVEEIILYYDAWSKKHQKGNSVPRLLWIISEDAAILRGTISRFDCVSTQ